MATMVFLATLVALHFTPVSKRVIHSFGLQPSSVAWSLRACFRNLLFHDVDCDYLFLQETVPAMSYVAIVAVITFVVGFATGHL